MQSSKIKREQFQAQLEYASVLDDDEEARDAALSSLRIELKDVVAFFCQHSLDRKSVLVGARLLGADINIRMRISEPHHYTYVSHTCVIHCAL